MPEVIGITPETESWKQIGFDNKEYHPEAFVPSGDVASENSEDQLLPGQIIIFSG